VKPLVDYLARSLVDDPDPVEVEETLEGDEATYLLKVGKDDLGKVIGKKGRTAKALRTLIAAAGSKQSLKVTLDIAEPDRAEKAKGKRGGGDDASDADADDAAAA
jgi:predicted RNA-binding protein YlqC (UPF0109 family)